MRKRSNTKLSEISLIEYFKKRFSSHGSLIKKGIGDDAAVIAFGKDDYLLVSCDMLLEGRHFRKTDQLDAIGWKAMACSLSDIAAMGGVPFAALISLGIPKKWTQKKVRLLYKGIQKAADSYSVSIIGGDVNASDRLVIDVSMLGRTKGKKPFLRSSARQGDFIFVTGALGGSLYGRHLRFFPRVEYAQFLKKHVDIHAMIDISDGLLIDLGRIIYASGVGAIVYKERIPRHKDAKDFSQCLSMGEDFELLFTLSAAQAQKLMLKKERNQIPFALSCIGTITCERKTLYLVDGINGGVARMPLQGFVHF